MDLNIVWFILITVLFVGYFFLEGFDYGVGILLPFLGKDDKSRRMIINTIGPHWDGNEVWLLTAGGAIFAAFPNWYATMFSGFYLALFLMLIGLIMRAMAFEFRSKDEDPAWRSRWDWAIFLGSFIPALLWGVAFANVIKGVPIDQNMNYTGGFFNLLNPYALVGGLAFLTLFTLHGAIFLTLKLSGKLKEEAEKIAKKIWFFTVIFVVLFVVYSIFVTDIFVRSCTMPRLLIALAALALIASYFLLNKMRNGWAFIMTSLTILLTTVALFMGLFPRVMVSSTNPEWSLTIYNASSSPYTLQIMTIVAAIFVPVVLLYQGWTYVVFKKRISETSELKY
jgi:cytochrome d ubiquinol oxidase subunit II